LPPLPVILSKALRRRRIGSTAHHLFQPLQELSTFGSPPAELEDYLLHLAGAVLFGELAAFGDESTFDEKLPGGFDGAKMLL
jgi:hypothetical protein